MGQFGGGERWGWGGARVGSNFPFLSPLSFSVNCTFLGFFVISIPFILFSSFYKLPTTNAGQIAGTIRTEQEEDLNRMFDKKLERQKDNKGFQSHNVYSHTIAYRLHASHEI